MIDCQDQALSLADEPRSNRFRDDVLYDATLRNLQTLSEATQRLPDSLKALHPDIPWVQISGFRNILVHNYLGDIDVLTVLSAVQQHLPPLSRAMQAMLAQRGQGGASR